MVEYFSVLLFEYLDFVLPQMMAVRKLWIKLRQCNMCLMLAANTDSRAGKSIPSDVKESVSLPAPFLPTLDHWTIRLLQLF